MMTDEQMLNTFLLAVGMFALAAILYSIGNALDDRTPEQKERDKRAADKKQWCEHMGGPCRRVNNYKRPYRYCVLKCGHYRMSKSGLIAPKFYRDVYGDD